MYSKFYKSTRFLLKQINKFLLLQKTLNGRYEPTIKSYLIIFIKVCKVEFITN